MYKKTAHISIKIGLLLIYILAITPKYALHHIFATHQHSSDYVKKDNSNQTSFDVKKNNCDCEDLFSPLEFETPQTPFLTLVSNFETTYNYPAIASIIATIKNLDNKGPPANQAFVFVNA